MASPNPPPNTTTATPDPSPSTTYSTSTASPDRQAQYRQLIRYTSLSALLLCPTLLLLPPRKLDVYTVLLLSSTGLAGNQVVREYTGRSLAERVRDMGRGGGAAVGLPAEVKERRRTRKDEAALGGERAAGWDTSKVAGAEVAVERRDGEESGRKQVGPTTAAVLRAGREREDWKARRDAREREALEDGRGYGGLITDQIWEVWNWGRERKGEDSGREAVDGGKDEKK